MATAYSGLGGAVEDLRARAVELQKAWDEREFGVHYFSDPDHPVGDENQAAEQFRRDLEDFRSKNGARVEALFADLPELFRPFERVPEPTAFRSLADDLTDALGRLVVGPGGHADFTEGKNIPPTEAYEQLGSSSTYLADWTGLAASQFRINVLPKVPGVVWNEFSAVAGLRGPLLAAENTYKKAQEDLCKLVDSTSAQLDAVFPNPGGSLSVTLGLIGAVVGVVALPFTLGGSTPVIAAGFTVATTAVGAAGAAASAFEGSDPIIQGKTPEEIVQAMREGLQTINSQIFSNELFAAEKLGDLTNELSGTVRVRNPHQNPHIPDDEYATEHHPKLEHSYTMPRPALADTRRGNATDDQHVGKPED